MSRHGDWHAYDGHDTLTRGEYLRARGIEPPKARMRYERTPWLRARFDRDAPYAHLVELIDSMTGGTPWAP